jgi:hypothetical protein
VSRTLLFDHQHYLPWLQPFRPCISRWYSEADFSVITGFGELNLPSRVSKCLDSIPLNANKSLAFLDYIVPFIDMQSTLAYLKNPPPEYMLEPVDLQGGIEALRVQIRAGAFRTQFDFEKRLNWLLNVQTHDGHFIIPTPLLRNFGFASSLSLLSLSKDGVSIPEVYSTCKHILCLRFLSLVVIPF